MRLLTIGLVGALLLTACGGEEPEDSTPSSVVEGSTVVSQPVTTTAAALPLAVSVDGVGGSTTGPIEITVTVTNTSDVDLVVLTPYATPDLVRFRVSDADGPIPFDGPFAELEPAAADRFVTLAPGESVSESFDLSRHFMLTPGTYTVIAEYRNQPGAAHQGERALTFLPGEGPVSTPVTIEVIS